MNREEFSWYRLDLLSRGPPSFPPQVQQGKKVGKQLELILDSFDRTAPFFSCVLMKKKFTKGEIFPFFTAKFSF